MDGWMDSVICRLYAQNEKRRGQKPRHLNLRGFVHDEITASCDLNVILRMPYGIRVPKKQDWG